MDWHGDHLHTNYGSLYHALRQRGFFLDVLTSPLTTFDAELYGALLLFDAEEPFTRAETEKLYLDVRRRVPALFHPRDCAPRQRLVSSR